MGKITGEMVLDALSEAGEDMRAANARGELTFTKSYGEQEESGQQYLKNVAKRLNDGLMYGWVPKEKK